jgi:hypothetical protein
VFGRAHIALGNSGFAVEEVFRACYTMNNFRDTALFGKIVAWETKNLPLPDTAGELDRWGLTH